MKRRNLTEEELALWRQAMRNTRPLPGRGGQCAFAGNEAEPPARAPAGIPAPRTQVRPSSSAEPVGIPANLDAATQRQVRRGRAEVEGRVDLHGMRQAEAHAALTHFIAESQALGRRCVLVITGKGGRLSTTGDAAFMFRDGDGVLRRHVPLWLSQEPNASRVFAVEQAHARHGGAGALYVFLRKNRRSGGHT